MKIYDISQEIFTSQVYPGDPQPQKYAVSSISDGEVCNVTAFSMCAHNGTHIDAPLHFFENGTAIDKIPLEKTVGFCYVACHEGKVSASDATEILSKAKNAHPDCSKRILIKGDAEVTYEAAKMLSQEKIYLIGNESQSVGPCDAPMSVHKELLSNEIVLLEGIRLDGVCEGVYFLNAAPLMLGDSDGSPCRAILIEL